MIRTQWCRCAALAGYVYSFGVDDMTGAELGQFVHEPINKEVKVMTGRGLVHMPDLPQTIREDDKTIRLLDPESGREHVIKQIFEDDWAFGERKKDTNQGFMNPGPTGNWRTEYVTDSKRKGFELGILDMIRDGLLDTWSAEIEKADEYEQQMAGEISRKDVVTEKMIVGDLRTDALEEAERYVKMLKEKGIRVSRREYEVDGTNGITLYRIGQAEYPYEEEASRVVQILDEYADKLGTEVPNRVTVIDYFDLQPGTNGQVGRFPGFPVKMSSCSMEIFNSLGFSYKDEGLVVIVGEGGGNEEQPTINKKDHYQVLRHELSHLVDEWVKIGTVVQREGFASMCEANFSTDTAISTLRQMYKYTNDITPGLLIDLMDTKDGDERHVDPENYAVTGSFFSFIYEKLGPAKFMDFYSLVTGGKVIVRGGLVKFKRNGFQILDEEVIRDTQRVLEVVTKGTEQEGSELIKEFVRTVNSKNRVLTNGVQ